MLSALLLVNAWSLAPYSHIRPTTRHAPITMQEEADDKPLDMSSLSQRIANIKAAPEPEVVRLLILDSMCPRQRLQLEAPPPLIESIDYHNCSFVMVGSDPRTRQPNTHGVEVTVEQRTDADGGGAIITLAANRLCEVVGVGEAEGSGVHRCSHRTERARGAADHLLQGARRADDDRLPSPRHR